MEITEEQYARIKGSLPVQRGNVKLLYLQIECRAAGHGCKWRGLPKRFGNWHTPIYRRHQSLLKTGPWTASRTEPWKQDPARIRIEAFSLDSTSG